MMDDFVWKPGLGPDQRSLKRLREHFPKPKKPMGEAYSQPPLDTR